MDPSGQPGLRQHKRFPCDLPMKLSERSLRVEGHSEHSVSVMPFTGFWIHYLAGFNRSAQGLSWGRAKTYCGGVRFACARPWSCGSRSRPRLWGAGLWLWGPRAGRQLPPLPCRFATRREAGHVLLYVRARTCDWARRMGWHAPARVCPSDGPHLNRRNVPGGEGGQRVPFGGRTPALLVRVPRRSRGGRGGSPVRQGGIWPWDAAR
jgi:hypothetical protein